MQVMYHFCSKNTIPSRHKHIQPFPVNYTKMLIKTKQRFPCPHRSKVVFDFIKVQQAFAVSSLSILIKAISNNLPWLIVDQWGPEVWKDQFQFTERSFATCSKYCI